MAIERTALENSNEKIYHRITLEEQVCIDGQNYELRGLVVHQGLNTRTGHYYAYVKDPMRMSPTGQQWAKCDCLSTKFIQHIDFEALKADSFLSENVTLLIFERNGMGPPPDSSLWTTIAKATGSRTKTATQFEPTEDATQFEPEPTKTTAQFEPTEDATQFKPTEDATQFEPEPTKTTAQFEPTEDASQFEPEPTKTATQFEPTEDASQFEPEPTKTTAQFEPTEDATQFEPTETTMQFEPIELSEYEQLRAEKIARNNNYLKCIGLAGPTPGILQMIQTFGPKEKPTPPRKRKSAPEVIVPPRPKSKRKVRETSRLSFGQNGTQQTAKESEQAVKAFFKSDDKLRAGQKGRATAQTMYDDNAEDSKEDSYEYEGDVVKEPLEGVIEEKGEGVIKEKGDYEHPKSLAGFPMATSISLPMPEDCKENHTCTVSTQGTQGSISFPIHDATSTITIAVQKLKSHFPDSFNDQWSTVQAIVEKFIRHQFHDDIASSFQTLQDVSHVRTGRPMVYLELLVDTDGKYSLYIGETGNHKSRIEFKLEEKKKMGTIVALLEVPDHLCSHLDPAVQQLWDLDLPFFRGTTSDKREKMLAKIKRQLVECFFASWIDCHTKHVCEALTNDVPSHFKDVFTFSEDILKELVNFLGKVKDEGKVEHEDPDEEDDDDGTYIGTDFTRLQFVIDHEWKGNSMLATKFNVKKPGLSLKQFLVERLSGKQKIRFEDAVDTCLVQEEFDKLWDKLLPLLKEDIPKNMDEILELLHEFGLLWVSDFNNGYLLRPAKNRMLAQGTREVLKGILDRPKDTITYIQFIQWESLQLHKKDWLDENIPNRIKLGKLFVLLKDSKGKRILVLPGFFRGFLDKLPVHIRVQILNALLLLNEASRRQSLKSDTEAQALTDLVTSFLVQGCGREARANVLPGGLGQNSFPSLSSWSSETQLPSELIATFIHKMDADSFSVKDVRDVLNAYKVKFGVPKSKSIPVEPSQSTPAVQSKSQSIPGAQSKKTESKSQYISAKPSPATQPKSQSTPAAPSQSVPKATREEISELAKSNPDSIELHFEKRQVEETVQCLEGLQG